MTDLEKNIDRPVFHVIADCSREMGVRSYIIGGFVRDLLLGRPSDDIDVVTVGSGIELAKKVASKLKGRKTVKYYGRFGTAMINVEGTEIEFVGARRESYDISSRKPTVENGTLEDDQKRRDFTINALGISLNEDDFGTLLDPFDGIQDMQDGIIRTPLDPDVTYSDDPLRMMRAVRFATRLGFRIEDESFKAIQRNAERIRIISMERVTEEINKMLMTTKPSVGFILLEKSGLLPIIFPQMHALIDNDKGHKDIFRHTLKVLDNVAASGGDLWLRWAAVLHDIAKPLTKRFDNETGWTFHGHEFKGSKMVHKIFANFKLPLDNKMKYVEKLVLLHLRPIVLAEDIVTDSAVRRLLFDAGDDIDDLMTLCDADITSKNEEKKQRFHNNFKIVRQKLQEIEAKDHLRNWQPPVTGEIIMQTFGIPACKTVGTIKDAIREAVLDGNVGNNFEEAYAFMKNEGAKLGLSVVCEVTEPTVVKNNGPVPTINPKQI